jgi:hypothetical protein
MHRSAREGQIAFGGVGVEGFCFFEWLWSPTEQEFPRQVETPSFGNTHCVSTNHATKNSKIASQAGIVMTSFQASLPDFLL